MVLNIVFVSFVHRTKNQLDPFRRSVTIHERHTHIHTQNSQDNQTLTMSRPKWAAVSAGLSLAVPACLTLYVTVTVLDELNE